MPAHARTIAASSSFWLYMSLRYCRVEMISVQWFVAGPSLRLDVPKHLFTPRPILTVAQIRESCGLCDLSPPIMDVPRLPAKARGVVFLVSVVQVVAAQHRRAVADDAERIEHYNVWRGFIRCSCDGLNVVLRDSVVVIYEADVSSARDVQ